MASPQPILQNRPLAPTRLAGGAVARTPSSPPTTVSAVDAPDVTDVTAAPERSTRSERSARAARSARLLKLGASPTLLSSAADDARVPARSPGRTVLIAAPLGASSGAWAAPRARTRVAGVSSSSCRQTIDVAVGSAGATWLVRKREPSHTRSLLRGVASMSALAATTEP